MHAGKASCIVHLRIPDESPVLICIQRGIPIRPHCLDAGEDAIGTRAERRSATVPKQRGAVLRNQLLAIREIHELPTSKSRVSGTETDAEVSRTDVAEAKDGQNKEG